MFEVAERPQAALLLTALPRILYCGIGIAALGDEPILLLGPPLAWLCGPLLEVDCAGSRPGTSVAAQRSRTTRLTSSRYPLTPRPAKASRPCPSQTWRATVTVSNHLLTRV